MESYGNDMFLSQEGYASIDFTLLDRPSTSVASAPEFTAPLLPDSSFPSLDFLDGSGIDSLGGVLRNAEEAHFHSHGRPELHKDMDWRKEKALHASSANMYIQGGENPEPKLSSSQLHIPIPQGNFFSPKQSGSDNLQAQLSTSGNRVGDEVHDFFEQEHLSQQQSQLDKANWSVMNNNAWPDDSQNNESRHIQQSSYNTEPNTQPDEGRHSSRMALGVRSPQEGPNNNVMKGVSRNRPLIFDSLVNGSSAGHIRSNQANSAGDGGTPAQNQSSTGSLAGPDIQLGHIVGQLQAGPQFHGTRLQPGLEEQLWTQFSYQKHLQELQRQQQIPQLEQHARQQQAQQLEQQARQPQSQQLGQQARQAQAQLVEQQVRRQQVQQFMQHAQQLEHQARQQQVQQLEQQARQHQPQQLEHARQQQLEQHFRQQQLLAGDEQNLGNQFSPSPYGSSMHNVPNFMHSGSLMSQMAIESHNLSLSPGNIHKFNAGSMNGMLNCSPSVPGSSTEALLSQDPYLKCQAMTLMGAHRDPSVYGSSASTMRDAAGQPLNLYPGSQVAVQELADTANKIPAAANHQVEKPVVRTPVLGASVLGNSRTSSLDPTSAENDGKQKALGKSLFGQSFSQNFTQPSETPQGISNFPQGTTIPRYDKNENENITQLELEQEGSHVQKCEDQTYHTRNEVGKDTSASFQHQDPNINSSQNEQIIKQESFHMGRFPRNPNADNQESDVERYEQATESNYQLRKQRKRRRKQMKRRRTYQDASLASQGEFLNIGYKNVNVDPLLVKQKDVQIVNFEKQVNQLKQQLQDAELRTKKLEEQLAIEKGKIDQQTLETQTLKIEQEKIFQSELDKFKNYPTLDQFKNKALETNKLLSQQLNEFCLKIAEAESLCEQTSSLIDEGITFKSEFDKAEKTISDFLLWQDSESGKRTNFPKIMKRHKEIVFSEWKHHLIRAERATSKAKGIMNNVTQMVNDNLYAINLITDCSPGQLPKVKETGLRWKQEISNKTQQISQLQEISWDLMWTYLIELHSQQTAIKCLSNAIDCIIPEFSDAIYTGRLHKLSQPEEVKEMLTICHFRTFLPTNDQ